LTKGLRLPSPDVHDPPEHVSGEVHALPQPPQLASSVFVSTHPDPQQVCPPVQAGLVPQRVVVGVHVLMTQSLSGGHTVPQAPQLAGSPEVSMHPLAQHCSVFLQALPPLQVSGGMHLLPTQV